MPIAIRPDIQGDTTDVAVKIRLKRMGKIRQPYYRIVVADSRTKRDGRVIEEIGKYHPKEDPSYIEVDSERAQYWLGVGAQPSEPVAVLLKVTGDWQRFKGEAAPAPMKVAETKRDKAEIFNEALQDAQNQPKSEAVTPRRSTAKKAAPAPAEDAPADDAPAATAPDAPADDAPAATADDAASAAAEPEDVDEVAPVEQTSPVADPVVADEAVTEDAPARLGAPADDTGEQAAPEASGDDDPKA
jgi:small subunit ribosomal protein S16